MVRGVKPYPLCNDCGKHPHSHALLASSLACQWDGKKVTKKGDFGPATALIVASVYSHLGKKVPAPLVRETIELKKKGVTTWS